MHKVSSAKMCHRSTCFLLFSLFVSTLQVPHWLLQSVMWHLCRPLRKPGIDAYSMLRYCSTWSCYCMMTFSFTSNLVLYTWCCIRYNRHCTWCASKWCNIIKSRRCSGTQQIRPDFRNIVVYSLLMYPHLHVQEIELKHAKGVVSVTWRYRI